MSKEQLILWKNTRWVDLVSGRVCAGHLWTRGGRFVGTGAAGEGDAGFGPADERVDLEGRLLLPGLTDAHCHLVRYGLEATRTADLTGCRSMEELLHRLKEHAGRAPGAWVIGRGFDQELLKEKRFPHRQYLDEAFPDRPVLLHRVCCHAVVANGAALRRAGLTSMDGLFTEDAMAPLLSAVPAPTLEETVEGARYAVREYNRNGFTAAHILIGDPLEVRALQTLRQRGELTLQIEMILPHGWIDALERTGFSEGFGDETLRVAGLKSFADGSLGARTAALRSPYSDDPGNSGLLLLDSDELTRRIRRAHEAGFRCAVHAIGDAAVEAVIRAAEATKGDAPPPRVEHASVVDPRQAERMGRLGMSAAVQPQFVASDFWMPERLGPEREGWSYAFRTLNNAGVTLAGSTDCPIEKPVAKEVYRNYTLRADNHDGEVLSPEVALRTLTVTPSRSLGGPETIPFTAGSRTDFLILKDGVEWPLRPGAELEIESVVVEGRKLALDKNIPEN